VDISDRQRRDLGAALRSDPGLRGVRFESRQQVYARFKRIYAEAPDLVGAVKVDQIPESFLVTLAEPAAYAGFHARFTKAGVDEIVGYRCPAGRPMGAGR
jgi:cell division transport system permease protein